MPVARTPKAASASKEALNLCKSHVNLLRVDAELQRQNCHLTGNEVESEGRGSNGERGKESAEEEGSLDCL